MVQSAAVVFSSPSCGPNVEKHFKNLQSWLLRATLDETTKSKSESFEVNVNTKFAFEHLWF